MKIIRFRLHPYNLPMAAPVQLTHHTFTIKKGWLLTADNDRGITARAEIPCLPGVHPLPYNDIPSAMGPVFDSFANRPMDTAPQWNRPLFGLLPPLSLPTQLLFALESLLLDFYRKQFLERFGLPSRPVVPINELFIPGTFETHTPAASTLKIKTPGLKNPASVIKTLLTKKKNCKLRLDPNRTLNPDRLRSLIASVPSDNLEYVEDPYPNLWEGLRQFDGFPLALDKELASALKTRLFPPNTVALVIKPSRDLALSGTLELIMEKKYKIVISSAYETPTGIRPLIHLAAVARTPCGLDVQKLFRPDPSLRFHPITDGNIALYCE